jgi:hypothetical protein
MTQIKNGSKWSGPDGAVFIVISTVTVDGKDWVYYRTQNPRDHQPPEFSCFEESFLTRFRPLPE